MRVEAIPEYQSNLVQQEKISKIFNQSLIWCALKEKETFNYFDRCLKSKFGDININIPQYRKFF